MRDLILRRDRKSGEGRFPGEGDPVPKVRQSISKEGRKAQTTKEGSKEGSEERRKEGRERGRK